MFLGSENANPRRMVSDQTAQAIDHEVKEIVETAHQYAVDIVKHNLDLLEKISTQLLEAEVIEGEELQSMLSQVRPTIEIPAAEIPAAV